MHTKACGQAETKSMRRCAASQNKSGHRLFVNGRQDKLSTPPDCFIHFLLTIIWVDMQHRKKKHIYNKITSSLFFNNAILGKL